MTDRYVWDQARVSKGETMPKHEIRELTRSKVICGCGWNLQAEDPTDPKEKVHNQLLDAYNTHLANAGEKEQKGQESEKSKGGA